MKEIDGTDTVIRQLIQWAEQRDTVRAMLLTSTRAIPDGQVDILSDYDVILIVTDIHPYVEDKSWLTDFGEVLVVYWDPIHPAPDYGIEQSGNVTQYADGLKIDFTLWPTSFVQRIVDDGALPEELDAGYRILLDKDNLAAGMVAPTFSAYIPARPTNEAFQTAIQDFFSDVPYVAKCLWRDELLPAKWCLDYDMKHVYLRQMLEWRMEIDHGWSAKVGALGKGLKKRLPPDIWAELEGSFVGADIEENWGSLVKTVDLFRRVALDVAASLGYSYPHALDQRVMAYVQKIRALGNDA